MLSLPQSLADPLQLADWLELLALTSPDLNSSRGDLEGALRIASQSQLDDDEAIEGKVQEVFSELEQRQQSAGESYPFTVDFRGILQAKSGWDAFPAYAFCLLLSNCGSDDYIKTGKLFEQLSCYAIDGYLQCDGNVVPFGSPRVSLGKPFHQAVEELCDLIGEGEGYSQKPALNSKDDRVDLVAWRSFADKRSGKLLIFGQCASGRNWKEKLSELNPDAFCDLWMSCAPMSPKVKAFFVPYRIDHERWDYCVRYGGILFDRCRIAFWGQRDGLDYTPHIAWTTEAFAQALV